MPSDLNCGRTGVCDMYLQARRKGKRRTDDLTNIRVVVNVKKRVRLP